MARCRLGKRERALRKLAFESLTPEKTGKQTDGLVTMTKDHHVWNRLSGASEVTSKARKVSAGIGDYGITCAAKWEPLLNKTAQVKVPSRKWEYSANTARSIHNRKG